MTQMRTGKKIYGRKLVDNSQCECGHRSYLDGASYFVGIAASLLVLIRERWRDGQRKEPFVVK